MLLAVFIVCAVAVIAHSGSFSSLRLPFSPTPVPTPLPTPAPLVTVTPLITPLVTPHPSVNTTPLPTPAPPYRIYYTDKPFAYPVVRLPDNMETFGASEIPQRDIEMVTFAYVEDSHGGLTRTFSVPYPVWVLNTTVIAKRNPAYANFRMALCSAKTGEIIEGEEILNYGSVYRIVQTSSIPMYMIISTTYVDQYRIELQTSRQNYDAYRAGLPFPG